METPEGRELRRQWSTKKRKNPGRPKGVPDGYPSRKSNQFGLAAKEKAEEVTKIMSEKYDIKDDYAKDALQTAVEVMQVPGETRERLAAARLVLDFTASRPAAKSEVTIGKAEEFLASLLTRKKMDKRLQKVRKRLFSDFESLLRQVGAQDPDKGRTD